MQGARLAGGPAGIAPGSGPAPPRNGVDGAVGCAHMLCPEPATALLVFDARVTAAWLVDCDGAAFRGLPMCSVHANRFRPPVGWSLSDQRSHSGRQRSGTAGGPAPVAPPAGAEADEGSQSTEDPVPEPAPTPLLTRAFRTTAQSTT